VKNAISISLSTPICAGFTTIHKCLENYSDWKNELKGSLLFDLCSGDAKTMINKAI